MKKIIGFLSLVIVLIFVACSNKPAEVKKEVIVVPVSPVVVVKDPVKPTTIIMDKNGVKVATKKIDVTVKKQ